MNTVDLALVGIVVFFVFGIGYVIWHKQQIRETWTGFAKAHGLTLEMGTYCLLYTSPSPRDS